MAEAILGMTQHARYWPRAHRPGGYEAAADARFHLIGHGLTAPAPTTED